MKARILVLAVNDGDEYVAAHAVRSSLPGFSDDERVMAEWQESALADANLEMGDDIENYGFIDVEIPDDKIDQVLRRHADAGVVAAEVVEP